MNKAKNLARSLPAVCRALTGQKGIKLVFRGPPRTDGNTIYSNPLPLDADERQTRIITGDIDHECGHVLYTDFSAAEKQLGSVDPKRRQFVHNLHNAIEDTFIERRLGEDYLGCRENLKLSVEYMAQDEKAPSSTLEPGPALTHYVDTWGRMNVLGHDVEKLHAPLVKPVEEALGENGRMRLDALLSQHLYSVDSTEAGFKLTRKIEKLLEEIADEADEEQQQQDQQHQGDQGNQAGNDNGSGASNDATANDSGAPASGGQPSGGDSGQNAPNAGDEKAQTGGHGAGCGEAIRAMMNDNPEVKSLLDRSKAAEQAINEATAEAEGGFTAGESLHDGFGGKNADAYHQLEETVRGETRELQRRIVAEYQSMTRRRQMVSEEGRLDSRRLHRALMGDRRIYRHKVKRPLPYPAVSVVLDCSGSMAGQEILLAKQALIVLAEVNQTINVKTELLAFAGSSVHILKHFEQPLQSAHAIIGGVAANGGTPTAEALWHAGLRLAARREERKLLMIATDGMPNNLPAAQAVAQRVLNSGIELYGLGIGADAVQQFCPRYSVLSNPTQIADAVLSALRSRLMAAA
ncbi:cobaltochelatase CobT-related protein [Acidihalobacter prosperus]|uniref:VWFA domain-containing protein n=1 Tax=Acidihalobacter prosperus TaxID=160660 RepID=A0A1A6C324_9GAMM|nr:VWA domain-containing protein [Acidihalobacter prosperus]OBS08945.1 hypothetical protein Thpro_022062 [Acidihalobacter prosperus]